MYSKAEKRFLRINFISILSLFLLILAGGIVRSSGSGMGCPDWPKCFDQYIPPTDISQLPKDYQEKYVTERLAKNERFAKLLDKAGYKDLAFKIRNDESIKVPEEFNPVKTYTEYINRLIGALTGIFLVLTCFYAWGIRKARGRVFWISLANILLVVFQAWLGSIVVSTNLVAWIITIHMLVAILILAVSIYTYHDIKSLRNESLLTKKAGWLVKFVSLLTVIISIVQITIGTEVREAVDAVQDFFPELKREEWLDEVGRIFVYHRDIALLVVLLNTLLYFLLRRKVIQKEVMNTAYFVGLLIALQIVTGLALSNFALAPWAQATHVLFATVLFGAQFYLLLIFKNKQDFIK
ncbi:COX15/CtaA family protein [Pedobacter cryophilus]|uniref:Heme A synthase n=1 Tax=Pedobacter cryophilus TaxID=2571271 RepID=A0A4U1C6L1_9SPHI|nr:COX15/CtaA family protein [Pedobacter cryophilus]TKC00264.1 heme A synthase [Pedobacter cryophilus]